MFSLLVFALPALYGVSHLPGEGDLMALKDEGSN
jgi:hypothetical protein